MNTSETYKSVPEVDPQNLIAAYQRIAADREELGTSSTVTASIISLFASKEEMEPREVLDITYRIFALFNFLGGGGAEEWTIKNTGTDFILINDALLRAASVAPLIEASTSGI